MENHEYIRKVIDQHETLKLSGSLSMSDTNYSSKSSRLIYKAMMANPICYEEAVSLLQYCRLLSKVCQCLKSQVLEQWLLKLIYDLSRTRLQENQQVDHSKYKETVSSYCARYFKEFKDRGIKVRIDDALKECEEMLKREKKFYAQIMAIGSETTLLREALFHPLKLLHYSKNSNAAKYMS